MPSEKQPFYDPIPPTYDEALASGSRHGGWGQSSRSPVDEEGATGPETQSLLQASGSGSSSSRLPNGYRAPTVETDDEDSEWDGLSDIDEADQVRQEMEEMDIEEPETSRISSWRKRIPFGLSLPTWKWTWRPTIPRVRIQLPSRANDDSEQTTEESDEQVNSTRWQLPKINSMVVILTVARLLALFIILGFFFFLFTSGILTGLPSQMEGGRRYNAEEIRSHIQATIDTQRLRKSVKHFSSYAHMAGTEGDYATAMDIESMFKHAGLDQVRLDEYNVYINYPRKDGRNVQIMDSSGENAIWTAKLEEEERHTETAGRQTYTFHGLSKSGDVKGPLIYANRGLREDFQRLQKNGVNTKGAIALVRYYDARDDPALKVKAAEMAGFIGCIIYSDPADDGFLKGEVAPNGRFMPADGVQRASVGLRSWVIGDVLTPGWESTKTNPRMKVDQTQGLVHIPSMPIAWRDAQVLLQHLNGHGDKVPDDWRGGVPEIQEWWTGNSSSPIVRLQNEQDENERQPIWNVYGKIVGMEQSAKSIIIGNHRDSWAFGASDPHSGTAVLVEMARIFGNLVKLGWRPLRTIRFMSWDGGEYNLIGSTEYVENNLKSLRENAYAYINLDKVVTGTQFHASGSPVFRKTLLRALDRVVDPVANVTLKKLWEDRKGELGSLGAGSDYAAFQDIAGTSSLDLDFRGEATPRHSSYDTFGLVDAVIDQNFVYHGLMGEVVGLLILDLADRAILPFDMRAYGDQLTRWVDELQTWMKERTGDDAESKTLAVTELKDAAEMIKANVGQFERWEMQWDQSIATSGGWESNNIGAIRVQYNDRMSQFETSLLDTDILGGVSNQSSFAMTR